MPLVAFAPWLFPGTSEPPFLLRYALCGLVLNHVRQAKNRLATVKRYFLPSAFAFFPLALAGWLVSVFFASSV